MRGVHAVLSMRYALFCPIQEFVEDRPTMIGASSCKSEAFMQYRDYRFPADTSLQALLSNETKNVQLVNISFSGARLSLLQGVSRNALLTLTYLYHRFSVEVMWTEGPYTGVRFLVPLSKSDLNMLRSERGRTSGNFGSTGRQVQRFHELE